ncbi:MAG: protein O-GlcNAc transferase [Aliidongia sp.]|nr:protein O-GlcNAc transferase [Aliidongia sp.]
MSDARFAEISLQQAVALHQHGRLDEAASLYRTVLERAPGDVNALHLLGVLRQQQGKGEEALDLIGQALAAAPGVAAIHNNYGNVLKNLARLDAAERSYRQAIALNPGFADAQCNLGRLLKERGAFADAAVCFEVVLAIEPATAEMLNDLGRALDALDRFDVAAERYRAALRLAPDQAVLHHNLGNALCQRSEFAAAEASLRRALKLQPDLAASRIALGNVLKALERPVEAVVQYRAALAQVPGDPVLLANLGTALLALGREDEAEAALREAVGHAPDRPEIRINHANALNRLGRHEEALAECRRALDLDPESPEIRNNLAGTLAAVGQREAALAEYQCVIDLRPDFADGWYNLGNVLMALKRFDDAAAAFRQAIMVESGHARASVSLFMAKRLGCDWSGFDEDLATLGRAINDDAYSLDPFAALMFPLSPAQHQRCAENAVTRDFGRIEPLPSRSRRAKGGVIRLAYLSANYHRHAVAALIAELFERHDRTRFEVTGISFGPDDGSPVRRRLMHGFDRFIDVRGESDAAVARRLAALEIDVAIDLMGHTLDHRLGILAHRPAPVQVAFLGYPGTVGARFLHYVIADPIVLPRDQQPFWTEQIVHLPGCYQVNDAHCLVPTETPSRQECGLPDGVFVFCCFNNSYKITPDIFGLWLDLLAAVPDGVLWLLHDNDAAMRRLKRYASVRGIDPERLIFAPIVERERHLARHRLADLFLDTLPYNAHTTASDALRMGLPLVTCLGTGFAGRVAASLLTALNLPELIAQDLETYAALAMTLARDPARLTAIRTKLKANAANAALFDGNRFRIGLEAAYEQMMQRHDLGLAPEGFAVPAGG